MSIFRPANIQKLKEKEDIRGLMTVMSQDADHARRREAADALGALGQKSIPSLLEATRDPSKAGYAIRALGETGNPSVVEPLIEIFNAGRWTGEAASALGRLGDRRAVEPLIAGLNQKYKTNTLAALGKLGDKRAVPAVISCLDSDDSTDRAIAARVLGELNDPQAIPALELAYASEDATVAEPALNSLKKLGWTPLVAKQMLYMVMTWNREGSQFMTHLHNQYGREDEIRARFHNPWAMAQVFVVQQTYEHSADKSDTCKACKRLAQTRIKTELSRQNPIDS